MYTGIWICRLWRCDYGWRQCHFYISFYNKATALFGVPVKYKQECCFPHYWNPCLLTLYKWYLLGLCFVVLFIFPHNLWIFTSYCQWYSRGLCSRCILNYFTLKLSCYRILNSGALWLELCGSMMAVVLLLA